MTVQVSGNLSPFGKPITCAVIRITCVDSDVILEGSKLHTCTDDVGDYSFDLEDGAYLVEYKQKDVMVEIGHIYVNETTPTPTDLISLVNSSPLVPIPDVPTTDTDWDTEISLHEGDAVKNYELNQAVSNEASSLDYEEASSTANSYLGRSIDEVKSKHSQSSKQVTSFSEEGNSLVIDEDTLSTSNITKSKNISLFEDTDEEYKESDELTTTRVKASKTIQHSKYLTDYKTTITQNITSDFGYKNKEIEFIQNDQREVTTNRESESLGIDKDGYTSTVGREDSIVASYRDDASIEVLKPQIEKSSKSTIQGDTNFVEVEEATKQNVNKDNESFGSWYKKITTYTKEAVDRLTNDGITSVKEYIVDIFKVGDLIQANTKTKQVKINGQLIIDNPQDFQGDTVFEVFQYSVDGVNDWHDEFVTEDLWRRFNTSVNGYVDPLKWSEPMLLQAQDGAEGDTVYYEYRYSSDNSSWHSVFVDGDIWRQERVIENGFPINDWSSSARIKGADGEAGDTVYIEYQYSIDGLEPWHSNFSTGDHYRRERLVTNGVAGAWSDAAKLVPEKDVDYADGYDGAGMYWIEKPNAWFPVNWSLAYQDFYDTFGKFPVNQDHLTYTNDPNNSKDATLSETARWDGTDWIEPAMIVDGDMLVKGTVTAEHIQAKSLTGGEISSATTVIAGSGNTQAGMNGYDSGIYNGWRFWAGNATPSRAPFRVNRSGKVWLTNMVASGTITGSSISGGTIKGTTISASTINGGTINGATGNFSGTVTAGKIIGDVVSAQAKSVNTSSHKGSNWKTVASFSVKASTSGRPRTLQIGDMLLRVSTVIVPGTTSGSAKFQARVVIGGSVVQSSELEIKAQERDIMLLNTSSKNIGTSAASGAVQIRVARSNTGYSAIYAAASTCVANLFITGSEFT